MFWFRFWSNIIGFWLVVGFFGTCAWWAYVFMVENWGWFLLGGIILLLLVLRRLGVLNWLRLWFKYRRALARNKRARSIVIHEARWEGEPPAPAAREYARYPGMSPIRPYK